MPAPYVSVVIPTLNEQGNIGAVIREVKKVLSSYAYEIIVVDSHSKDRTARIAKELGARVIEAGPGKGAALKKGLMAAKGSILISMDADLSHTPIELKLLIAGIETGYDICMGSRFITGGGSLDMPPFRLLGNKIFISLVNLIFHTNYTDLCYGYRSFRRSVLSKLNLREKGFGIEAEISIDAKKKHLKVLEVPSMEKKRERGEGKLRSFSDGFVILETIIRNM